MFPKLLFALVLSFAAFAQDTKPPTPPELGTITGIVTVDGTGAPMAGVDVSANSNTPKEKETLTDSQGRYTLRGIEPGQVRVTARAPASDGRFGFGPGATRPVNLLPGQELAVDFRIVLHGVISGKVFDQNKEPVPGVAVYLVSREYVSGVLRSVFTGAATTNDEGEYSVERVQPGRAYFLLAKRRSSPLDPISEAPAEPSLRRPAVIPTFYPNSRTLEGSQPLVVRSGERREGIDIRLVRSPSYCLEGVIEGGPGPADLRFAITETQPSSGISESGGMYTATPGGKGGSDGRIRICDLHPGEYELTVTQSSKEQFGETLFFGSTIVNISDRDIQNVRVTARPRLTLSGEVVWDGPAPEPPLDAKLRIFLESLTRTERGNVQASIPGEFQFEGGLVMDEFRVLVTGVPKGVYIKEVTYGDRNVLREPLRLGRAIGNSGMRVVLARNGGTVSAKVADHDGNPVSDCPVVIMPANAASEGAFAAAVITGRTNQNGSWSSTTLAPGKYYAIATRDPVNKTPESIAKLLAARGRAQEVDLQPNGAASITLTPKGLE